MAMDNILKLIIGLILVIAVAIPITSSLITDATETVDVTNESFTGVNGTAVSLDNDDLTVLTVQNGTSDLTLDTDYEASLADGTVTLINNAYNGTSLNADYTYKPDTYIDNSIARLILPLILIALAIGALVLGFSMRN